MPFILVHPRGHDDGFLSDRPGRTLAKAQKMFASPQRWRTFAAVGWEVVEVDEDEFRSRLHATIATPAAGGDGS